MKIVLTRENMYLVLVNNCVYYTFDVKKATDFSNMEVERFKNFVEELKDKEMCEFEIEYITL